MNKPRPYIGVTGATSGDETKFIAQTFKAFGFGLNAGTHDPMVGFLVSYKTLNGKKMQNRRYPNLQSLASIIGPTRQDIFTTIHYNSLEIDTLAQQIKIVFDGIYKSNLCRGLQLNIQRQDIEQLNQIKEIKDFFPDMKIIFQANESTTNNGIQGLLEMLQQCKNEISYILLDPSAGQGKKFDPKIASKMYQPISTEFPNITIGFAGGFTGNNVIGKYHELYTALNTNDFSIDAEGGLRDKAGEGYGNDTFSDEKVKNYIQNSSEVFK